MEAVWCVVALSPEGESEICRARAATQGQPVRAGRRPPRSGALEEASTSGTLKRLPGGSAIATIAPVPREATRASSDELNGAIRAGATCSSAHGSKGYTCRRVPHGRRRAVALSTSAGAPSGRSLLGAVAGGAGADAVELGVWVRAEQLRLCPRGAWCASACRERGVRPGGGVRAGEQDFVADADAALLGALPSRPPCPERHAGPASAGGGALGPPRARPVPRCRERAGAHPVGQPSSRATSPASTAARRWPARAQRAAGPVCGHPGGRWSAKRS